MRPDHPGVLEELGNEEKVNNAGSGERPADPGIGAQVNVRDGRADDQLSHSHRVADEHCALEETRFPHEAVTANGAGVSHRHEATEHRPLQTDRAPFGNDGPQETRGDHPGHGRVTPMLPDPWQWLPYADHLRRMVRADANDRFHAQQQSFA